MKGPVALFDVVSVGHFSIDSICLPSRKPVVILGGSAAYVAIAASRLGARVGVVSKVGGDFPEAYRWWLGQEGINLSGLTKIEDSKTTRFELTYDSNLTDRTLLLRTVAPPLTATDLPTSLRSRVIHVCPITSEITYDIVETLKGRTDFLSLDPQGFVRVYGENGEVQRATLADKSVLELVDIYKSSLNEIGAVTGLLDLDSAIKELHDCGVGIVIVTLGSKGAVVSDKGTQYNIPAAKPDKVVDPTGAGDAFIGSFLAEFADDENIVRCACVGAAAASFVVEGVGPTSFADKTQVYQRARELYEKQIKE
jgi:sugar/nucleoside kinase (ribokinase family)